MTTPPWYRFWSSDYKKKTAGLSLLEHGAFRILLDHYYDEEEQLPCDRAELYRIARAITDEERAAVDKIIGKYFHAEGGRLVNDRAEQEIKDRAKRISNKSVGGKASAAVRIKKYGTAVPKGGPNDPRTMIDPEQDSNTRSNTPSNTRSNTDPNTASIDSDSDSDSDSGSGSESDSGSRSKPPARPRAKNPPAFVLPDSIHPEVWKAFEAHRDKMRKPMTDRARVLILRELVKIGGDSNAILDQSIRKGWQDVFPIKDNGAGNGTEPKGFSGLREYIRTREEGGGDVRDVTLESVRLALAEGERR